MAERIGVLSSPYRQKIIKERMGTFLVARW